MLVNDFDSLVKGVRDMRMIEIVGKTSTEVPHINRDTNVCVGICVKRYSVIYLCLYACTHMCIYMNISIYKYVYLCVYVHVCHTYTCANVQGNHAAGLQARACA